VNVFVVYSPERKTLANPEFGATNIRESGRAFIQPGVFGSGQIRSTAGVFDQGRSGQQARRVR